MTLRHIDSKQEQKKRKQDDLISTKQRFIPTNCVIIIEKIEIIKITYSKRLYEVLFSLANNVLSTLNHLS